jgi:Ca-activated chloride channel homolog
MRPLAFDLGLLEQPMWLLGAVLLPLAAIALIARRAYDRRRRIARLGDPATVARIFPGVRSIGSGTRMVLLGGALACMAIAFAGPRWGAQRMVIRTAGADVVDVVDASLSMLATDERPNRLERAKEDIRILRAMSPGDRTALIAFAGRSYILSPLTVDDGALALFLDNLDPSVVGQPGTSIARAIRQATDLLMATRTGSDRAIVIFSDGEGWESEEDVRAAAAQASQDGISLVTVGYGTESGSTIPLSAASGGGLKRDEDGAVVITHYTPSLLKAAAEAAHGTFIPATATDKAANVRRALAKLRVTQRTVQEEDDRTPRFQYFLAPALLLLLLDTLLSDPRRSGASVARRRARRPAPATRTPAAAALIVALGLPTLIPPSRAAAADRAAAYRRAIDAGDHTAQTLYNYGTALLAADSIESAISVLSQAADLRDSDVRYRAWFNVGLAHLRRGLAAQGDSGSADLDAALDAYKRVLIARPQDADARWNYELALRKRQSGGGGGAGGGGGGNGGTSSPSPSAGGAASNQSLAQRQAEEILNNAAREEREVLGKTQHQQQPDVPPGGRDW